MKTTKATIKRVERLNDAELIKGIKFGATDEVQIVLPNRKVLVIKTGHVTVM